MNTITQFFSEHNLLSEDSKLELSKIFLKKEYQKREVLSASKHKKSKVFFLESGIACSALFDKDGKEYIRTLFKPNSIITSLPSFLNQKSITINYVCLTDCSFLEANYSDFKALTKKHHDIALSYISILNNAYAELLNRNTQLATLDASDRYLWLKEMVPAIENEIPQYQIAAYLNITPIQLSRIRKNLYSK